MVEAERLAHLSVVVAAYLATQFLAEPADSITDEGVERTGLASTRAKDGADEDMVLVRVYLDLAPVDPSEVTRYNPALLCVGLRVVQLLVRRSGDDLGDLARCATVDEEFGDVHPVAPDDSQGGGHVLSFGYSANGDADTDIIISYLHKNSNIGLSLSCKEEYDRSYKYNQRRVAWT